MSAKRAYRWLGALPAICMLAGIPFANRVEPYILGLPFLLFWILLWVVATSAVLRVVYALDEAPRERKRARVAYVAGEEDVGLLGARGNEGREGRGAAGKAGAASEGTGEVGEDRERGPRAGGP